MKLKKTISISMLCLSFLFFIQTPFNTLSAQNLILNGDCEDSLVNGEIPYWTEVIGDQWTQRYTSPDPYSGEAYFFPGAVVKGELMQDVDVSGYATLIDDGTQFFIFEGYVRSYNQSPADYSRVVIEYLDTTKLVKLDSIDFGNYSETSQWVQLRDTTLAPAGTRFIRIRLISTRRNGSNNDGYYDALSLTTPTTDVKDPSRSTGSEGLTGLYPNPFTSSITIKYILNRPETVRIRFYDQFGKLVDVIEKKQSNGLNKIVWTPDNLTGGVYYFQFRAGEQEASGKVVKMD